MGASPEEILKKVVEAFNAHDLDTVYGLLHGDYREYINGVLVKQGPDAARAADQPFYDAVPDYRREVDELFASGAAAAMRWRFLGTGRDGAFEFPLVTICKVEDGSIIEAWLYGDFAAVVSAIAPGPDAD
jgi:predicted ester cyclase